MKEATPRVLVAFYSREGTTEALANAVADGARSAGGEVRMRRAREVCGDAVMSLVPGWADNAAAMNRQYEAPTLEDAEWADAIVFGTPSRFGQMASELKAWIDSLGALWAQGKLAGKVGSAFASTSTPHGGSELTNFTMFIPMVHFGMVIVPPGYADPVMFKAGTPYGANTVSYGGKKLPPTPGDLDVAKYQGRRVAEISRRIATPVSAAGEPAQAGG